VAKRKLGDEVTSRIKARTVVVPFVAKIGPMVGRAVFLETVAARTLGGRPDLRREAAMLADEAREDLNHLDQQLSAMSEKVAVSTRVTDTRRALLAVVDRFERASSTL
jgi:hypothetical protein